MTMIRLIKENNFKQTLKKFLLEIQLFFILGLNHKQIMCQ